MFLKHVLLALVLTAVASPAKSLLVLPVSSEADNSDLSAINSLFHEALEFRYAGSVVKGKIPCEDRDCALDAAKAAKADEVVYASLRKLGAKWIFSATVLDASGGPSFKQRLNATSIEDFEAVSQRMADALTTRKNLEQVASLDNITESETADGQKAERRRSQYNSGIALGYLFPVGYSFSYLNTDPSPAERHAYDQMVRFTWLNNWEFRNNMALGADVTWSTPYVFGADLNLRYLMNRGDFTPFVGGGVGLHYVKSDEGPEVDEHKRNSGPALNVQGGLMLFRTYDVNVMLRGQYQMVFNSDVDHGPAIDVGVSFRPKEAKGGRSSSDDGVGFWGYAGIALITLIIIGAISN